MIERYDDVAKIFRCTCTEHALAVLKYNPWDEVGSKWADRDEFEISIWYHGHSYNSILDRLRHIWRIIRFGHPYADMIILDRETAGELRDYLIKELKDE